MGDGLDTGGNPLPNTVVTDMFFLPPRPLQDLGAEGDANGLFLLTLVDDRYFWWYSNVDQFTFVLGTTTWLDLLNVCLTSIGNPNSIIDPIPAAYGTPAAGVIDPFSTTANAFDYLAYLVGARVTRQLDGTIWVQRPESAIVQDDFNVTQISSQHAGGAFGWASPPDQPTDLDGLIPTNVQLLFPETVDGSPSPLLLPVQVTTSSLALDQLTDVTPNGHTKSFFYPTLAVIVTGTTTNLTALTTLAEQFAGDWLQWQLGDLDLVVNRLSPWVPTGYDQSIDWDYSKDETQRSALTVRIQRGQFNDIIESITPPTGTPGTFDLTVRDTDGHTVSNVNLITVVSPNLEVSGTGNPNEAVITDTDTGGGGGSDIGAVAILTPSTSISTVDTVMAVGMVEYAVGVSTVTNGLKILTAGKYLVWFVAAATQPSSTTFASVLFGQILKNGSPLDTLECTTYTPLIPSGGPPSVLATVQSLIETQLSVNDVITFTMSGGNIRGSGLGLAAAFTLVSGEFGVRKVDHAG
jgi:hypothetical protein